jgi:hypothetical protein
MTKTIDTLVDDIQQLFTDTLSGKSAEFDVDNLSRFSVNMANHVMQDLTARHNKRKPKTLYMSEIGKPCVRQVWYGVNKPELGEKMEGHTLLKFLYGDCVEELVLMLAEQAGHKVEKRQERKEWDLGDGWKVSGRIDAVIDGVLVDVKSCSPYAFDKFKDGLTDANDSFGYRAQLAGYNLDDKYKRMGFLAVDKQNGRIGFFELPLGEGMEASSKMIAVRNACSSSGKPVRHFELVPEGKSGNMKLCTECSYCPYKWDCWKDANDGKGLRAFAYSTGPVFLGTVAKEPKVPELHPKRKTEVVEDDIITAT